MSFPESVYNAQQKQMSFLNQNSPLWLPRELVGNTELSKNFLKEIADLYNLLITKCNSASSRIAEKVRGNRDLLELLLQYPNISSCKKYIFLTDRAQEIYGNNKVYHATSNLALWNLLHDQELLPPILHGNRDILTHKGAALDLYLRILQLIDPGLIAGSQAVLWSAHDMDLEQCLSEFQLTHARTTEHTIRHFLKKAISATIRQKDFFNKSDKDILNMFFNNFIYYFQKMTGLRGDWLNAISLNLRKAFDVFLYQNQEFYPSDDIGGVLIVFCWKKLLSSNLDAFDIDDYHLNRPSSSSGNSVPVYLEINLNEYWHRTNNVGFCVVSQRPPKSLVPLSNITRDDVKGVYAIDLGQFKKINEELAVLCKQNAMPFHLLTLNHDCNGNLDSALLRYGHVDNVSINAALNVLSSEIEHPAKEHLPQCMLRYSSSSISPQDAARITWDIWKEHFFSGDVACLLKQSECQSRVAVEDDFLAQLFFAAPANEIWAQNFGTGELNPHALFNFVWSRLKDDQQYYPTPSSKEPLSSILSKL